MALSAAATLERRPLGGIPAFYAAIWSEARIAAARWRLAIVVEVAMVALWFLVRTTAGVDGRIYAIWVIAAGALALVAPLSGLVVFVATSVAFEPDSVARTLSARELVLLPLTAGVLLRIALDRFRWRPVAAVWLALALLVGTALGLANTFTRFPEDFAWRAAGAWYNNMAAPVIVLVAAAWTARGRSMRVIVVACLVAVASALICLAEYASPGAVSGSSFEWLGFWKDFGVRLSGTIPSPNALSAQLIVPTAVLAAVVLLVRDLRLKALALAGLVPLLVAHYLTYSRSPLLGAYAFIVVAAWRIRRSFGIVALVGGLILGAILLPRYLELRSATTPAQVVPGTILVATDQYRIDAWGAAIAMWADAPLVGQGYLAYRQLGPEFGDAFMGSPHNEWLRFFAEEGTIIGLLGIAFVLATARSLARLPGWLGTGLLAGFLGWVIAASFNNPLLFIRVSTVAFSVVGVGLALATHRRTPGPEPGDDAAVPAEDSDPPEWSASDPSAEPGPPTPIGPATG
jgi:O-antigen ligase/polysaccharide polymerase Wzy-like membrane protein